MVGGAVGVGVEGGRGGGGGVAGRNPQKWN